MSTESALQKQKKEAQEGLANAPVKKKIGFFSAMMVVVGSSVGAGIFFKAGSVLTDSQSSIVFAMFCWIFAAFAVISMGLALIEIASARNDNLSMIGWCQTFNSRLIAKACKNFMFYVYLPLTYFFMPLYTILSFQDSIASIYAQQGLPYHGMGTHADWAILMVITIIVSVYFIVVCGLSSRAGTIQNGIITAFKFLPLVFAAILGFVIVGMAKHVAGSYAAGFIPSAITSNGAPDASSIYSFTTMTPGFGMFIAVGAIFFAFDGFYVAAGVQTDMKEPKKTPLAILGGLIIVTVIYLIIAIAMSLGSTNGAPQGYADFLFAHGAGSAWLYSAFQMLIAVGVLGIINGFALWSTRFVEDLIKANELPWSTKFVNKIRTDGKAIVGILYNLAISLPIILIFCIIGGLAYINKYDAGGVPLATVEHLQAVLGNRVIGDYNGHLQGTKAFTKLWLENAPLYAKGNPFIAGGEIYYYYGVGSGKLYSFCDLMATWTSVAAFTFILFAIFGALRNRKTNEVKVVKSKIFVPMAICAIITMAAPIFFTFFQPIADLFFLFRIPNLSGANKNELVSRIMIVVVLILYIGLMFIPTWIEDAMLRRKFGSVEAGEEHKIRAIAEAKGVTAEEEVLEDLKANKKVKMTPWQAAILGRPLTKVEIAEIHAVEGEEVNTDDLEDNSSDYAAISEESQVSPSESCSSVDSCCSKENSPAERKTLRDIFKQKRSAEGQDWSLDK